MKLLGAPSPRPRIRPLLALAGIATIGLVVFLPAERQLDASATLADTLPGTAAGVSSRGARLELPPRASRESDAGNLFAGHAWYVPPPPPPVVRAAPPAAPTAPPLPFEYLGRYAEQGGAPVYFLVRGDRVFDVRVGEKIDNVYSVDGERNQRLLLTYLPLGQQQTLSLEH